LTSSADLSSRDFRKILLIKLSAVGDVVHTFPVLNKLRQRYPAARLDWLTTPPIAELLRHNQAITTVIEFERAEWNSPWRLAPFANTARLAAKLRAVGYDLVLDIQGQLRSAFFTLATSAPVRIGFDRPRASVWDASPRKFSAEARRHAWQGAREGSWIAYTHHIAVPTLDLHAVDRYLNIGPILGLDRGPADFSFPIPQAADVSVDALLARYGVGDKPLMIMAPGTVWETKNWGGDKFAAVARHFMLSGMAVTLIGSRRDRAVCEEVAGRVPGAINIAGETALTELAALVRRSAMNVTNDSGPMHLAAALDRPVVSIFGPTDAVWTGPYRRPDAVAQAHVPCAPCYLRQLSRCHYGHRCMQEVSTLSVIERIERFLRPSAGEAPIGAQASAG